MKSMSAMCILLSANFLVSCGDKSKSENSENGSPSSGQLSIQATIPGSDLNAAVLFSVSAGEIKSEVDSVALAAGSMQLNIPTSTGLVENNEATSHLVMIVNSDQERADAVDSVKFLSINVGEEGLINMPTDQLTQSDLDLGVLSEVGDSFASDTALNAENIAISESSLVELATHDNALRTAKNTYANTDPESGKNVSVEMEFFWSSSLSDALDGGSDPSAVNYSGYRPVFEIKTDLKKTDFCPDENTHDLVAVLTPPEKILAQGEEYTELRSDQDTNCGVQSYGEGEHETVVLTWFSEDAIKEDPKQGIWQLKIGDEDVRKYDLSVASALDTESQKTLVYVPKLKVTKDSDDKFSGATVEMFLYDRSKDSYEAVTDSAALKRTVKTLNVTLEPTPYVNDKVRMKYFTMEDYQDGKFTLTDADFEDEWFIDENIGFDQSIPNKNTLYLVLVSYEMYGNLYEFRFRLPSDNRE